MWTLTRALGMACFALHLAGCSGDSKGDDTGSTGEDGNTGTLAVRFAMDADYIPNLDMEPTGTFYGNVFPAEGVSASGPEEGLEALATIRVEGVDVTGGGPTEVLHTTEALPPGFVAILGFLDEDKNTDEAAPGPDSHDPVTFPNANQFEVVAGEETEIEVYFGLLYP